MTRVALFTVALAACGGQRTSPPACDAACEDAAMPRTQTCTAAFSGGVTGVDRCAMTVTYTTATQGFTLSTEGSVVPSTKYTWTGVRVTQHGEPMLGMLSTPLDTTMQLDDLGDGSAPAWHETSAQALGALTAQLDDLGPFDDLGDGDRLYSTPHGRVDATLVDVTHHAAPDVQVSVTF